MKMTEPNNSDGRSFAHRHGAQALAGLAWGMSVVGLFWTVHQLSPPDVARALWQPAGALNGLLMGHTADSDSVGQMFWGYRLQEAALVVVVGILVFLVWRPQYPRTTQLLVTVPVILAPWLTNSEALVIGVASVSSWPDRLWVLVGTVVAIGGSAVAFWLLRAHKRAAGAALGIGIAVFSLAFIYWLNSPMKPFFSYGSVLTAAWLAASATARGGPALRVRSPDGKGRPA